MREPQNNRLSDRELLFRFDRELQFHFEMIESQSQDKVRQYFRKGAKCDWSIQRLSHKMLKASLFGDLYLPQTNYCFSQIQDVTFTWILFVPCGTLDNNELRPSLPILGGMLSLLHVNFILTGSSVTVQRQVILGLSTFLMPGGVHCSTLTGSNLNSQ